MSAKHHSPAIHPTAIIDPKAVLDETVRVGAYAVIEAGVEIGPETVVGPHVVISGPTTIGAHNQIYSFASVGAACQDKKYAGEPTRLIIGDHNVIRESVTLNRGTVQDRGETVIGSHNWLMAYVHVAHDCVVGDHTVMANNATLAGHVEVGDGVILGGFTGVHQFCKIGAYAMTGMFSAVTQDVPAYVMVQGNLAKPFGLNSEGMRRRGSSPELIQLIKSAYRILYRKGLSLEQAKQALSELYDGIGTEPSASDDQNDQLQQQRQHLKLFIDSVHASKRGIIR